MTTYEMRHAVTFLENGERYVESGDVEEATSWLKRRYADSLCYAVYKYEPGGDSMWVADFNCKSDALRVLDELNKGQLT